MYNIRVSGVQEFGSALERIGKAADAAGRAIVTESAAVVEARAKANFVGAHKRGEPHVGGNKPNVVSGMLRRSIGHTPIVRTGPASYATAVGPRTVYGRRVELGMDPTRPFPYLRPAAVGSRAALSEIATRRWAAVL